MRPSVSLRTFTPLLLCALVCGCTVTGREAYSPRFVYSGTEGLVVPILEARHASRGGSQGGRGEDPDAASLLLGKLLHDNSLAADEASVVLLGFYLGEANDEDLMHNLSLRGKRVLPYLRGYRERTVLFPEKSHLDSLRFPDKDRRRFFDAVIEAVEKGDVIGVD